MNDQLHLAWGRLEGEDGAAVLALASPLAHLAWVDRVRLIADAYELGQRFQPGIILLLPIVRSGRSGQLGSGGDEADAPFGVTVWPPRPRIVSLVRRHLPVAVTRIALSSRRNRLILWVGINKTPIDHSTIEGLADELLDELPACFSELVLAEELCISPADVHDPETLVLDADGRQPAQTRVVIDAVELNGLPRFLTLVGRAVSLGMRTACDDPVLCLARDSTGQPGRDPDAIVTLDSAGDHLLRHFRHLGRRSPGIRRIGPPYWGEHAGDSVVCLPVTLEPHATSANAVGCLRRVRLGSPNVPNRLMVLWDPAHAHRRRSQPHRTRMARRPGAPPIPTRRGGQWLEGR